MSGLCLAAVAALWLAQPPPAEEPPQVVGWVLSGGSGAADQAVGAPVRAGQRIRVATGHRPLELVLDGDCVARFAPGAHATLSKATDPGDCPSPRLVAGTAELFVSAQPKRDRGLAGRVGGVLFQVLSGHVFLTAAGERSRVCVVQGDARLDTPESALLAASAPAPVASKGQCGEARGQVIGLSSYGAEALAAARQATEPTVEWPAPEGPAPYDLAREVERVRARGAGSGTGAGSEVEGGGQSMCLESGSDSSAADVGQGGSLEVVKPLPPAQVQLRIQLRRGR